MRTSLRFPPKIAWTLKVTYVLLWKIFDPTSKLFSNYFASGNSERGKCRNLIVSTAPKSKRWPHFYHLDLAVSITYFHPDRSEVFPRIKLSIMLRNCISNFNLQYKNHLAFDLTVYGMLERSILITFNTPTSGQWKDTVKYWFRPNLSH